jgi:hypothetical protein
MEREKTTNRIIKDRVAAQGCDKAERREKGSIMKEGEEEK